RADRGGQIQRYKAGLNTSAFELRNDFGFWLRSPFPLPITGKRLDIGSLARDPFLRARIGMQVDFTHVRLSQQVCVKLHPWRPFPTTSSLIPCRNSTAAFR